MKSSEFQQHNSSTLHDSLIAQTLTLKSSLSIFPTCKSENFSGFHTQSASLLYKEVKGMRVKRELL